MDWKSDIEIAQSCVMKHIRDVAETAGISEDYLDYYGRYKAKLDLSLLADRAARPDGKLILVTAINPTPAGEGKTTTTVGLADGLRRLGKNAVVAAGALVLENTVVPDGMVAMGVPAKVREAASPALVEANRKNAEGYVAEATAHAEANK